MKSLLVFVAVMMCFSAYAATERGGSVWTAEVDGDSLQVTIFTCDGERVHGGITALDAPVKAFSGLSPADVSASASNVRFELRRAAGTIAFDGRFSEGTGAGHFRFTPSEAFLREMDALGYRGFTDEEVLMFAANDFSPRVIRELRAMGYQPTQRELEENFVGRYRIIGRSTPRSCATSMARS
jgi:hypothetical protein